MKDGKHWRFRAFEWWRICNSTWHCRRFQRTCSSNTRTRTMQDVISESHLSDALHKPTMHMVIKSPLTNCHKSHPLAIIYDSVDICTCQLVHYYCHIEHVYRVTGLESILLQLWRKSAWLFKQKILSFGIIFIPIFGYSLQSSSERPNIIGIVLLK